MLTNETKVNGVYMGGLYVVRTDTICDNSHLYKVEYNAIGKDKIKFEILHEKADGAEVLVKKCMDRVVREMKKKKK